MGFGKSPEGSRKQPNMRALSLENIRSARRNWEVSVEQVVVLKALTEELRLSVALGDLMLLDSKWYVTHSGLMRLARRNRCAGIQVRAIREFCDMASGRWIFKAIVYKTAVSKDFVGYGDADPSNVSPLVRGAEMRVAETRAVNRALRKAYGIGLCSVEELGWLSGTPNPSSGHARPSKPSTPNGSNNGQPRLRDHLCLLIRQYNLDPTLVKAYAAEFCGTQTLKEASRDLVESFISHLATSAKEDLDGLVCKLNSFAQPPEAKP
ncbi:MAG: hypothetical protein WAR24_25990 [Candidatus Acidiferrales bacterium]